MIYLLKLAEREVMGDDGDGVHSVTGKAKQAMVKRAGQCGAAMICSQVAMENSLSFLPVSKDSSAMKCPQCE